MRISDWSSDVCSSDLGFVADAEIFEVGPRLVAAVGATFLRERRLAVGGHIFDPLLPVARRHRAHVARDIGIGTELFGVIHELVGSEAVRSEKHTSEHPSLMRISYAVFCLKQKKKHI